MPERSHVAYADLLIGILIIVLLVIAAYHAVREDTSKRVLQRNDQGRLIAIGERERAAGDLSGRGTQTSAPLQLAAGAYRIDYQFEALTRLALIDRTSEETLLIKSGAGTEGFEVSETGRYRLRVEPTDEGAAWRVQYRQIGR